MTNDDRISALSLSTEAQVRDPNTRQNVGGLHIKKSNGKGAYGADIGDFLWRRNGTLTWDMEDPRNGADLFDNIYQYMAAEIHAPGAKMSIRRDIAVEYEKDVRSGVSSLSNWMDKQFGIPLYRCKATDSRNQITTITIYPDFVVDQFTGETAKEAQRGRDKKVLDGHVRSTLKRMARDEGDQVREIFKASLIKTVETCEIPAPVRTIEYALADDTDDDTGYTPESNEDYNYS